MEQDYTTKQSAGFVFVQILTLQLSFFAIYAIIVFVGDAADSVISGTILSVTPADVLLILCGIVLQTLLSVLLYMYWQRTEYRLVGNEVEIKRGLMGARRRVYALSNVVSYDVRQNPISRYYRYGAVVVRRQFDREDITLPAVPEPEQFVELMKQHAA